MKIRIYQVQEDLDKKGKMFRSLKDGQVPDSSIYRKVYDGEVDCTTLEEVYRTFNLNQPENYMGRSMSVSDVICTEGSDTVKAGFYYCNSCDFMEVVFEEDKTRPKELIRVLLVRPGEYPKAIRVRQDLASLQDLVEGPIEIVSAYPDVILACNEEGKLKGLPFNRAILREDGSPADIICGTFFLCGAEDGDFGDIPDIQLKKYAKLFHYPEQFLKMDGRIRRVPYLPKRFSKIRTEEEPEVCL